MKELNQKLAAVQTRLKTKKTSFNAFGKYYFRKAEDILEAVKPFLVEQGVTVRLDEELIATDPVPIIQSTATISDGENAIHATALVGVDLNQKGMQTAQQFGAASSYGKKYALGNLFLIDDTADADSTNVHDKSKAVSKITQASKPLIPKKAFETALDMVKSGSVTLDKIKAKYKLDPEEEKMLKTLVTQ
jgi:hypothetical protein